jgi:hypothetical protein
MSAVRELRGEAFLDDVHVDKDRGRAIVNEKTSLAKYISIPRLSTD